MKNEQKIEEIRNSKSENKSQEYLNACDEFEKNASEILKTKELGFICKKFAEEVSLAYNQAKSESCEYGVYAKAHSAACYMDEFEKHSSKY